MKGFAAFVNKVYILGIVHGTYLYKDAWAEVPTYTYRYKHDRHNIIYITIILIVHIVFIYFSNIHIRCYISILQYYASVMKH